MSKLRKTFSTIDILEKLTFNKPENLNTANKDDNIRFEYKKIASSREQLDNIEETLKKLVSKAKETNEDLKMYGPETCQQILEYFLILLILSVNHVRSQNKNVRIVFRVVV